MIQPVARSALMSYSRSLAPATSRQVIVPTALLRTHIMPSTIEDQQERLNNQRRIRPVSPHLTIYGWTPSMMLSIMHRGTGMYLTGGNLS